MLRLKNIIKTYEVGGQNVDALKGVSIAFRKSEFVSILGPSGCGKTTTLNIIGGLDKYSSGDLFIAGKSTKEFNDHDWDVYRNHRVGFIFQSYNLIPHQTILGNVELALTIAGISKEERVRRAKEAIDRVGLAGQYNKKPNQLSGGQCQRVAIARALVNEPEILLADEPTGALDTETSVQIMELIKEISKDKLVIMVTHNPDLAQKYSTRIINFLDGKVIADSNPFTEEEEIEEVLELHKDDADEEVVEKAKMSFVTATKLSFRNLLSKLKRTIMVVVAGSIGIIGVATVLSVSRGVNDYIDIMQDDMLSGNPITIQETGIDMNALMNSASTSQQIEAVKKGDYVNVNSMIEYLVTHNDELNSLVYQNDITEDYINYLKAMPTETYSAISYNYGLDLTNNVYTDFHLDSQASKYDKNMSLSSLTAMYTKLLEETEYGTYSSVITSLTSCMSQSVSNNDYISSQYDVVYGTLPKNYNDIIIVLDSKSSMTDLLLTQMGYYTQNEFFELIYKALADNGDKDVTLTPSLYKKQFTYEELVNKKFTWYSNDTVFEKNTGLTAVAFPYKYSYTKNDSWDNLEEGKDKIELNIVGIVQPKENINYGALTTGFLYTQELSEKIISLNKTSNIATAIKDQGRTNIPTIYNAGKYVSGIIYDLDYYFERDDMSTDQSAVIPVGTTNEFSSYLSLLTGGNSSSGQATSDTVIYTITSRMLGAEELPSTISIYPLNFEQKDLVTDYLDKWNDLSQEIIVNGKTIENRQKIKYTDQIAMIIFMIDTMINVVTWALVAFTALSLVVSTVMVGIITYVSVVERTKEIGVIRSLGGRKKDVSHLFNAETFMIGFASGVFGIIITGILSLVINLIVNLASDGAIKSMAHLTPVTAIVMVLISVALTLISGFFPSRSAASRNPVDALRSE